MWKQEIVIATGIRLETEDNDKKLVETEVKLAEFLIERLLNLEHYYYTGLISVSTEVAYIWPCSYHTARVRKTGAHRNKLFLWGC